MNLKREAARVFGQHLEFEIPALSGKIRNTAPDFEDQASFPGLVIVPQRFVFEPWLEEEVEDDPVVVGASNLLVRVGEYTGQLELKLGAGSICGTNGRDEIEQAIINAFFKKENEPGVLTLEIENINVMGVQTTFSALCTFRLDAADWKEEMVFSKKRFSLLEVDAWVDVYAIRYPRYTIEQLVTAFTEDLSSESPTMEEVVVNEDGSVTPSP